MSSFDTAIAFGASLFAFDSWLATQAFDEFLDLAQRVWLKLFACFHLELHRLPGAIHRSPVVLAPCLPMDRNVRASIILGLVWDARLKLNGI